MVDKPRIDAQQIRGSSQEIPTLPGAGQVEVNFRAIPTVRPTGLEAQARALNVQAQSLQKIQNTLGVRMDETLAVMEETQTLEAQRIYADTASMFWGYWR